jgi:hypothetical protein
MLSQATVQDRPWGGVKTEPALSSTSGNGLSDVDRHLVRAFRPQRDGALWAGLLARGWPGAGP